MDKSLRILVVCGGFSTEREVSLRSGKAIYDALLHKGYFNTVLFDLTRENITEILGIKPDIVFLGLHGRGGEDGSIQGLLELAGIPYTGSGVGSSAVCMDKVFTKRILDNAGIPTPPFKVFRKDDFYDIEAIKTDVLCLFGLPMVLKSPSQGSSIGMVIVDKEEELNGAIGEVFKYGDYLLVEQYVDGPELSLPIMGDYDYKALPIIEISTDHVFYDYAAKYTRGLSHHIIPANIDKLTEKEVIRLGIQAYKELHCQGLERVDFIVDMNKGPQIIEVDTLPGMTDMSLFPDAARYIGINYDDLVERILEYGLNAKRDLSK